MGGHIPNWFKTEIYTRKSFDAHVVFRNQSILIELLWRVFCFAFRMGWRYATNGRRIPPEVNGYMNRQYCLRGGDTLTAPDKIHEGS